MLFLLLYFSFFSPFILKINFIISSTKINTIHNIQVICHALVKKLTKR